MTSETPTTVPVMPAESSASAKGGTVTALLAALRKSIRRYLVWQGVLTTVVVAALCFWASFLMDELVFTTSRYEMPLWFRRVFLIAALLVIVGWAVWRLGLAITQRLRERALALVLERRFPQLDSRLILAVEAQEGGVPFVSPMHDAMVQRTLQKARQDAESVKVGEVFNRGPLRRSGVMATVLGLSIAVLAILNFSGLKAWANGYLHLNETYRDRKTELVAYVLAQPGDRKVPFEKGQYRHPKGSDLTLLIETAEGKAAPERIRLDYRLSNGRGSGRTYLEVGRDGKASHTFTSLIDSTQVWLTGGDYTTLTPLVVSIVDPPIVSEMGLLAKYPEYTGLNASDSRTLIPVVGTESSLPMESQFDLVIRSPKPLDEVRLELQAGALRFDIHASHLTTEPEVAVWPAAQEGKTRQPDKLPNSVAKAAVQEGGCVVAIPFVLHHKAVMAMEGQADGKPLEWLENSIPLPPDTVFRIWLTDAEKISATEPARLLLRGIVDENPQIETHLRGIGTSITRLARIPISGVVTDDYGVSKVWFEYSLDADTTLKEQPLELNGLGGREIPLMRSESEPYVRFDVLPLDLSLKQKLTVSIAAADSNNVEGVGPNLSRGQRFVFTIVSPEELLSILYSRELNERKRFEQVMVEVRGLRDDLIRHREMIAASRGTPAPADLEELLQSINGCAERSIYAIRQISQSTESVRQTFREIREELVNNSVDTPQMLDRIDRNIVAPLSRLIDADIPATDSTLGLFRLANQQSLDPTPPVDEAILQIQGLLEVMDQVLLEMRKLETFHEAIELLKGIIGEQEDLKEKTRQQRKAQALKALEE